VNRTERIGPETPPRWRNTVRVWNQGAGLYDLVYEHEYVAEQVDCSLASDDAAPRSARRHHTEIA